MSFPTRSQYSAWNKWRSDTNEPTLPGSYSFIHRWIVIYIHNIYIFPISWEIQLVVFILIAISQERKRRSVPSHVEYEVDASENNFDEKVTERDLKDSDSDNSGSDARREKEVMRELRMFSWYTMLPAMARLKSEQKKHAEYLIKINLKSVEF